MCLKNIFKWTLVYACIIIMFFLFMLLGCLFSSELIEKNVKESSVILCKEGLRYQVTSFFNGQLDNYTDVLMINEAYSVDSTNPLYSALSVRKNYKKGQTKVEEKDTSHELKSIGLDSYEPDKELSLFLNGKIDTSINYARYWHGYLSILRVLLLLFNVSEIRIFFFFVFCVMFICLFILLKRKLGLKYAIIFSSALLLEGYFYIPFSLQNIPIFLVMMICSIILLYRINNMKNFSLYIFIVGCCANFFDYLTVPLITLGMPLYIYILYLINNKRNGLFDCLKIIIKSIILWFVGYAVTWFSKWLLFDLLYDGNLISLAIEQVLYRTVGDVSFGVVQKYGLGMLISFFVFFTIMLSMIYIFPYYVFVFFKKRYYKKKYINIKEYFVTNSPIFIISLLPIIWYVILSNHTLSHYWFVCRHMLIFLIGFMVILTDILDSKC